MRNEIKVYQAFINDHMDHRIEHGHIGIGLELQGAPGVAADVGHARVGQHNLRALFGGVLHPGGSHRVVAGGVSANDKDQLGVLDIVDLVAHSA